MIKTHMYDATQLHFAELLQQRGKDVVDLLYRTVKDEIPDYPDALLTRDGYLERQRTIVFHSLAARKNSPEQEKLAIRNLAVLIRASELARQAKQTS
jgi:hypothetical protein